MSFLNFSNRATTSIVALLFTSVAAFSIENDRDEQEKRGGKPGREESWQIEQRQKWFEESRGLRQQKNASELRRESVRKMREENKRVQNKFAMAGETWSEMGPSAMQMGSWSMGRVSGRLNAITPHPSNENIVYVASAAGGVWKTTDGGGSWTPLMDQVGSLPSGAVHLQSDDPNKVWVGTGDKNGGGCAGYFGQGVFYSADGGANWSARNGSGSQTMPLSIVNSVVTQPTNGNVVLAGGYGNCDSNGTLSNAGIFRSTDAGTSWTKVLTGRVEDMVFVPNSSTVYATVETVGVHKSTDGGATWTKISNGMTVGTGRMRIAMAPSNSNILYVLMGSSLYRTTDAGATWSLRNSSACEGQCTYNQAISVHPTNSDTILVGSIRYARSTNGGTSLTYLTGQWGSGQKVHQDTHVLMYSKSNGNRFWVGSDGGIWRSDDGGTNYVNMNANLNITQFYDVAIDVNDPTKIFGGAQDNSSSGRTSSKVWNLTFASGDGFMNVVDPSNNATVLQTSYPNGSLPYIVRSMQGGAPDTFSQLSNSGLQSSSNFPWVTPLAAAGSKVWVASDRVYFGTTSASSFSWTAIGSTLGSAVSVITPVQNGSSYPIYVGTSGGRIYFSSNGAISGATLTDVTGNYPGGRVSDIAFDKSNTQRVFVTRGNFGGSRLYRSSNGGSSWTGVGAGLPSVPANAVALDPANVNRVFVGTDIGMYVSEDGGDNFVPFNNGMPLGNVITDLEVLASPYTLVAGTYGRGAWKMDLSGGGNVPPTANFNFSVAGLTVNFSDISTDADGTITARNWNFGDGTTSTATNPSRTYTAAGTYNVTLTVTDNANASSVITKSVSVGSNVPPTANFNFAVSGLTATFTDTSTDSDGSISARAWNFGDGGTSTETNPSRTYAAAGTYNVTLQVTDNAGATATSNKSVTVVSSGCTGTSVNGSFSGASGQTQIHPNGSWYQSTVSGSHKACLSGPAGTDFDLYLDKWNGSGWSNVAKSEGETSVENINYTGTAGYYRYRVINYSGTGAYTLTYSKP